MTINKNVWQSASATNYQNLFLFDFRLFLTAFRVTRLVSEAVQRQYGALFGVGTEILKVEATPTCSMTMPDLLTLVSDRTILQVHVKSAEFLL